MPVAKMKESAKPVPRVAIVGLDAKSEQILKDCFKPFGIDTVRIEGDSTVRLRKEKFEACALELNEAAEDILKAARTSPSNKRILIYGLVSEGVPATRYSKYGINATMEAPLEKQATLKTVRATHLLIVNELRRYVRVPIVMEVKVEAGTRKLTANSLEVSGGGMSLATTAKFDINDRVSVKFTLPDSPPVMKHGTVCWVRDSEQSVGVRFDPNGKSDDEVKRWINDYLGI
jgi:Tfp pilus assembly protein PilZ